MGAFVTVAVVGTGVVVGPAVLGWVLLRAVVLALVEDLFSGGA